MNKHLHPANLLKSPVAILLAIMVAIFLAEALVMLVLHFMPSSSWLTSALFDATLLVLLISPFLYYLPFLSLIKQNHERQQMENILLHNKEERFKLMIRASLDGFWMVNLHGRFLEVNDAYCQMTGYTRDELLLMCVSDVEVIESPQDTAAHIQRLLQLGSERFETRHRHKDGHIIDIEVSANYRDFEGGRIYSFLRDITQRKQAEHKLLLSENILNNLNDTVFLLQLDGTFTYLNETAWKTRGYTQQEMMQMTLRDLNTPENNEKFESHMQQLLQQGSGNFESAHRRKDGSIMPVEINARIIGVGEQRLLLSVVRDISKRKQFENALRDSEEMFRSMSEHTKDALIMMDNDGYVCFWNAAAEKIFGYTAEEVMGRELHDFIAPDEYREGFRQAFTHFRETGEGAMVGKTRELEALRKGGQKFAVELAMASLMLKGKWYAVGLARDITERRQVEDILRENESRLFNMFENLSSGVAIIHASADGASFRFTALNRAAERIENLRRIDVIDRSVEEIFPDMASSGLLDTFRRVYSSGAAEHCPITFQQNGHVTHWREYYVYKLPNSEIVAIYDDITKEKQAEERMHFMAHYDPLTRLPNRALFSDRLQLGLAAAKREKHLAALMFIDLDKFKPVNDELGHDMGDMLLQDVAQRMRNCLRESDTVARIGGDEFVVLLPRIDSEHNATDIAAKILHSISQPFELAGNLANISCSIGIAIFPTHGMDEKQLSKHADQAMYHAKNSGRNMVQIYTPGMSSMQ